MGTPFGSRRTVDPGGPHMVTWLTTLRDSGHLCVLKHGKRRPFYLVIFRCNHATAFRNEELNEQVCKYMNYQGSESYKLVPTRDQPHIKNRVLRVRYDETPIFPRPSISRHKRSTRLYGIQII